MSVFNSWYFHLFKNTDYSEWMNEWRYELWYKQILLYMHLFNREELAKNNTLVVINSRPSSIHIKCECYSSFWRAWFDNVPAKMNILQKYLTVCEDKIMQWLWHILLHMKACDTRSEEREIHCLPWQANQENKMLIVYH